MYSYLLWSVGYVVIRKSMQEAVIFQHNHREDLIHHALKQMQTMKRNLHFRKMPECDVGNKINVSIRTESSSKAKAKAKI